MNMLTHIDPDLLALQQVRDLLCKAQAAAQEFAKLDEVTAKNIAKIVSEKLSKEAQAYAELELAEGGFGKVADKVYKNLAGSQGTYATWKDKS